MSRYGNTLRDDQQRPIPGAKIYVYKASDESLATLTEDGGGPLANPLTSDAYGNFYFNAPDAVYILEVVFGGKKIFRQEGVVVGFPATGGGGGGVGVTPGDKGDIVVTNGGAWTLDAAIKDALRDRTTHTGTQLPETIFGLTETIQDTIAASLVPGSNITLAYDDAAGTITITAAGGGGGETGTAWLVSATGTGASQDIALPEAIAATSLLVFVDGIQQDTPANFTVLGAVLTTTATSGVPISVYRPGGPPGAAGAAGKTVLSGAGAPSSGSGANGDFYIDTTAKAIYGPKTAGAWGSATSLVGADGKTIYNGTGAPANALGADGDFYIATDTKTIFGPKASGTWPAGTSLVGPAGSVTDGDKGDITVSGGGGTWTVDTNAITLSKVAQIATATFLGRSTAGTGNVEALTSSQVTLLLDTFTTGLRGLVPAPGSATGKVLSDSGTWVTPSGSGTSGIRERRYAAGRFLTPQFIVPHASNAIGLSANTLYAMPFEVLGTTDGIAFEVTGVGSGSARVGIYGCNANGSPGALILDAGTISVGTIGLKIVGITSRIINEPIWVVMILDVSVTIAAGTANSQSSAVAGTSGIRSVDNPGYGTASQTYGALPTNAPALTVVNSAVPPMITLRTV